MKGVLPDGIYTAPTEDALVYDIEATQALGFNTIRKHVKVGAALHCPALQYTALCR